ncbi:molybdopterin-dependent oxidoreductase [Alsobacter sp. SYSU M60028]|uniref:Molybdopterin-dependent oxidoreductase n=1 Tax=Alsobacter ponti TaxID=2962936 RepID=A0ABT1LJ72_9HYPH|nr:molybdopterin cofactor-binding domain-containing protein [Alsobacter ponti]MCP8940958.1 molybdopterin-dependent oxidoreductase [Alsobacter ponti]
MTTTLSRRFFLTTAVVAGGGLLLGFNIPTEAEAALAPVQGEGWKPPVGGVEINAWLTIDPQGVVTIRIPHTEMGQGGMTSVAQLVAEELNVPWRNVRAVFADANRNVTRGNEYQDMSTGGSNLVRNRHPHIMQAGASARERLREAAAKRWGVSRADVKAEQGMLSAGGKSGSYGEFASDAAAIKLAEEPKIKKYGDWWLLGKDVPRMDVAVKVNGSAVYPIDVRVPGMAYAAVRACPVPGGKVKSFDAAAIKDRPGVIAVIELKQTKDKLANTDMRSAVAVVADSFYRAKVALDLLPIEWDFGPGAQNSYAKMDSAARALMGQEGKHAEEVRGDPRPILAAGGKTVTGDYSRPYETHVPMSPPAAVADVKPDRIDVWSFTQNVQATLLLAAEQAGRNPKDVFVHGTFQGGAFGNGNAVDITRQAVELSKQVGRPVKVIWSREEDTAQARSRPPIWARFEAVLGDDGLPKAMISRAVAESMQPAYADRGLANMPYTIPHYRYERHVVPTNIPVGPNRAPGNNNNGFTIEQFADELALAGGWDPLEWRLKMTEGNERWQRVLLKLKEVSGFTTKLPKGTGMGIAVIESHGATVGACATVEVSRRGALSIEKILIVSNTGYVINPRAATEQVKGCVAWELSHALYGGLDVRDGRVQNTNFDSYKIMRMPDMPTVESVFAMSQDNWWGGFGETAGPPTPPAVANAIFFATGKRIRSTPILKHDLKWA